MDQEPIDGTIPEGFVLKVVHQDDEKLERLSLQEAALSPSGKSEDPAKLFKLGRVAAKRALADLGLNAAQVLRGTGGEPLFPDGFVGSISHTGGTAAAVVGRTKEYLGLGLDIERADRTINKSIIDKISAGEESKWVKLDPDLNGLKLFCVKESIYKALFPLHGKRMAFKDVASIWNEEDGAFISTLLTDFGEPWNAGATILTLCDEFDGLIVAMTVIEQPADPALVDCV